MIFGTGQPRFVYRRGLSGEDVVDLDYAVVLELAPTTEYTEHRAEMTGQRDFIYKRVVWRMVAMLNLFKYADPAAKYSEIAAHKGDQVTLYRHRDGDPFRLSVDVDMMFVLKEITPVFLTTTDFKDGLKLEFESVGSAGDAASFPPGDIPLWLTWGQTNIVPLGDTSYAFSTLP